MDSLITVVVKRVVTTKSSQTPLTNPKRKEHLCSSVHPNLRSDKNQQVVAVLWRVSQRLGPWRREATSY